MESNSRHAGSQSSKQATHISTEIASVGKQASIISIINKHSSSTKHQQAAPTSKQQQAAPISKHLSAMSKHQKAIGSSCSRQQSASSNQQHQQHCHASTLPEFWRQLALALLAGAPSQFLAMTAVPASPGSSAVPGGPSSRRLRKAEVHHHCAPCARPHKLTLGQPPQLQLLVCPSLAGPNACWSCHLPWHDK